MPPRPIRTWREFVVEFCRTGLFSLRPLPMNVAERQAAERQEAARKAAAAKDGIQLNLADED